MSSQVMFWLGHCGSSWDLPPLLLRREEHDLLTVQRSGWALAASPLNGPFGNEWRGGYRSESHRLFHCSVRQREFLLPKLNALPTFTPA